MKREIEMELHFSLVFGKYRFLLGGLNDWQQRQQADAFLIPVVKFLVFGKEDNAFHSFLGKIFIKQ